jgi:hypothetical protein
MMHRSVDALPTGAGAAPVFLHGRCVPRTQVRSVDPGRRFGPRCPQSARLPGRLRPRREALRCLEFGMVTSTKGRPCCLRSSQREALQQQASTKSVRTRPSSCHHVDAAQARAVQDAGYARSITNVRAAREWIAQVRSPRRTRSCAERFALHHTPRCNPNSLRAEIVPHINLAKAPAKGDETRFRSIPASRNGTA